MAPPLGVKQERGPGATWLLVVQKLSDVSLAADGVQRERAPRAGPVQEVHVQDADCGLPPDVSFVPAETEQLLEQSSFVRKRTKLQAPKPRGSETVFLVTNPLFLGPSRGQKDDNLGAEGVRVNLLKETRRESYLTP